MNELLEELNKCNDSDKCKLLLSIIKEELTEETLMEIALNIGDYK